ncbi:MAG: rhodanese-like domain-containing protein [Moraxella sp.]|nr:rhodanese-like domain-containing protein [Moraxella sp.]
MTANRFTKQSALLATLLVSAVALTACNNSKTTVASPQAPSAQTATATAKPNRAAGVWIDVRGADEYNQGHLDGALNITHEDIAKKITAVEPNKSAPINLYCRSGRRAEVVRETLMGMGYTNVTNHGGYENLLKQGIK